MPVASVRRMNNYSLLEDNPESPYFGVVKVKSFVKRNDVLVGQVITKISKDGTRQETDHSTIVSISEEGKLTESLEHQRKVF